jgi:hypothetical protein
LLNTTSANVRTPSTLQGVWLRDHLTFVVTFTGVSEKSPAHSEMILLHYVGRLHEPKNWAFESNIYICSIRVFGLSAVIWSDLRLPVFQLCRYVVMACGSASN